MARRLRGRQPRRPVPLAALRRRRRLLVGQRPRPRRSRRPRRGRLPHDDRRAGPRLAPALGRVPDLPRPLRDHGRRARAAAVGQNEAVGRAADRPRLRQPVRLLRRRPAGRGAAPRPRRAPRRRRDLPDADLPGRHLAPVRLGDLRPDRPAARRRRGAALARPGRPRARAAADRRPDAQPFRQRPRVVHTRARGHGRAGALLLFLGRVAAARLRELVRAAAPAEAELGLGRADRPRARRRRALAPGGPRRLADRRRQHDRPLPRRRPHARGRARGARRGRSRSIRTRSSSPSTRTTSAPTCAATAGTAS